MLYPVSHQGTLPAQVRFQAAGPRFGNTNASDPKDHLDLAISPQAQELNLHTAVNMLRQFLVLLPQPLQSPAIKLLDRIEDALFKDKLSGVYNRVQFDHVSANTFNDFKTHKSSKPIALFMLDLDGFKPINDTYGHAAGDEAIAKVGRGLQETIEEEVQDRGTVCRIGGDEFAVVLKDTSSSEALGAAEAFRSALKDIRLEGDASDARIGVSQGIVVLDHQEGKDLNIHNVRDLKTKADKLMYKQWHPIRNRSL